MAIDTERMKRFIEINALMKANKKSFEDANEELSKERVILERQILDELIENEVPNFKIAGMLIYPHRTPVMKYNGEAEINETDEMNELVSSTFGVDVNQLDIKQLIIYRMKLDEDTKMFITENFHTGSVTSFLHGYYEEHGELPKAIGELILLDKLNTLRVKKA